MLLKDDVSATACHYYQMQMKQTIDHFHCHATKKQIGNHPVENKTPAETFPKFPSIMHVIDRSDRNPPITATSVTF